MYAGGFSRSGLHRRSQESHRAILEAVKSGNVELAQREMNLHLDIVGEFSKRYPELREEE